MIRPGGSEWPPAAEPRGAAGAVLVSCWSRPGRHGSTLHLGAAAVRRHGGGAVGGDSERRT